MESNHHRFQWPGFQHRSPYQWALLSKGAGPSRLCHALSWWRLMMQTVGFFTGAHEVPFTREG